MQINMSSGDWLVVAGLAGAVLWRVGGLFIQTIRRVRDRTEQDGARRAQYAREDAAVGAALASLETAVKGNSGKIDKLVDRQTAHENACERWKGQHEAELKAVQVAMREGLERVERSLGEVHAKFQLTAFGLADQATEVAPRGRARAIK